MKTELKITRSTKINNQKGKSKRSFDKKDLEFKSFTNLFTESKVTGAMVSLGNSFEFPVLWKKLGMRITASCAFSKVKLASRLRLMGSLMAHFLRVRKHHGNEQLVLLLKAYQLALQKYIAGTPISSLKEIMGDRVCPRLSNDGLPLVIPTYERRLIRQGSPFVIRWWLSIFSVYRVLSIPGKLKLSTITDPCTAAPSDLENMASLLRVFARRNKAWFPRVKGSDAHLLLLETSSPTSRSSFTSLLPDVVRLTHVGLAADFLLLCKSFGADNLENFFLTIADYTKFFAKPNMLEINVKEAANLDMYVGQLAQKLEAAGKIRVFALVDVWTQSILKPLHDSLFSFLKAIPNDATFDQDASVKRCFAKVSKSKCSFGFDLSAATDRLPISLQVAILAIWIGEDAALAWQRLLVNRDYVLREENKVLRYATGQPMGALSSWAMLAVTHHLIVQIAANLALGWTKGWYDNYELLGDDIVIFDKSVADQYLILMNSIGVTINLSKSVISNTECFEFAKVTGYKGKNVSALPWKAFISQNTLMGRVNIAFSMSMKYDVTSQWFLWFKSVTRKSKYTEGSVHYVLLAFLSMLAQRVGVPFSRVASLLINVDRPYLRAYRAIAGSMNLDYFKLIITQLLQSQEPQWPKETSLRGLQFANESLWWSIHLNKRYVMFRHRVMNSVEILARKIAQDLCVLTIPDFDTTAATDPSHNDHLVHSEIWMYHNGFFIAMLLLVRSKFDRLLAPFAKEHIMGAQSTDALYELNKDIDRFEEFEAFVERAKKKVAGNTAENVVKVDPPLKPIRFVLLAQKRRPAWTRNSSVLPSRLGNFSFY